MPCCLLATIIAASKEYLKGEVMRYQTKALAISLVAFVGMIGFSGHSRAVEKPKPSTTDKVLSKTKDYPFDCISTQLNPCPDEIELKDIVIEKNSKVYQPRVTIKFENDPDTASKVEGKAISTSSYATAKVKLINKTSYNFYWRLVQQVGSNFGVWPSSSSAYYTKKKSSKQVTISCRKGYRVGIGGTSSDGNAYFCYGVYFDRSARASQCQAVCAAGTVTLTVQ
jgi:hypothetical protein